MTNILFGLSIPHGYWRTLYNTDLNIKHIITGGVEL